VNVSTTTLGWHCMGHENLGSHAAVDPLMGKRQTVLMEKLSLSTNILTGLQEKEQNWIAFQKELT